MLVSDVTVTMAIVGATVSLVAVAVPLAPSFPAASTNQTYAVNSPSARLDTLISVTNIFPSPSTVPAPSTKFSLESYISIQISASASPVPVIVTAATFARLIGSSKVIAGASGGTVSTKIVAVSDAVFPAWSVAVAVISLLPSPIFVISTNHVTSVG